MPLGGPRSDFQGAGLGYSVAEPVKEIRYDSESPRRWAQPCQGGLVVPRVVLDFLADRAVLKPRDVATRGSGRVVSSDHECPQHIVSLYRVASISN